MAKEPMSTATDNGDDTTLNNEKTHGCPYAKWGIIASIVLAVIAIALSYTVWVRGQQQNQQSQLSLSHQMQVLSQQNATQLANMRHQVQSLSQRVANAASQSASVRGLNEASYFVRMANLNLSFNRNPKIAAELLKRADQQLQQANNPALNSARQAILGNISQLTDQKHIDVTTTLLQMNHLIDQVMQLQVIPNSMPKSTNSDAQTTTTKGWHSSLNHAWQQLKSLVVIRHQANNIEPLLSPEQFILLKNNVAWQLIQAQWAVLHQSDKLYQQNLSNAARWLSAYDNHNQADIGPIVNQIKHLQQQNANPMYPDLLATLKLINNTKQQLQQPGAPRQEAKPANDTHLMTIQQPNQPAETAKRNDQRADQPSTLKKLLPKTNKSVEI